jgi:myo-inositol-1(or 4)-monophosphatase
MTGRIVETLVAALLAAGAIHRRWAGKTSVSYKGRVDIVTQADKAAEKKIVSIVRRAFPDHGLLAEEGTSAEAPGRPRWVIDPLDGTINYAHGVPVCCVSIGVEEGGRMLAGGVYDAFREELFLAVRGKGARLNGRRIRVSPTTEMHKALLATGFPYDRQKRAGYYAARVRRALAAGRDVRRLGSAALDLCYVACGRFDAYWEFNVNPWDVSAGWLMVEEAGGKVTGIDGSPYALSDTSRTLATNGRLHPAMVRMLKG